MTDFADVSSHQEGADLAAYAAAGHDRILIKATEGTGYTNPFFGLWWAWAGRLGLARGAYHFARPSRSGGAAEADRFAAALKAAGGVGPRDWVCLDAEDPDERDDDAADHAAAFCGRMADHGHPAGLLYTGTWYAGPARLTAAILPAGWRRLHLATYNATGDANIPLPPGWAREQVVARQYTSSATQPGIPGRSDRNRVLRDWLPAIDSTEDDMPTADEIAAAVWRHRPPRPEEGVNRAIAKPNMWTVTAEAYNKAGNIEKPGLTDLDAKVGTVIQALAAWAGPDHPVAQILAGAIPDPPTTAEAVLAAVGTETDPAALARLIETAGGRLRQILAIPADGTPAGR